MYTYLVFTIMYSLNYEKYDSFPMEYNIKNMELELNKHNLSIKNNDLQSKKKVLEEKHKELDNINYTVWTTEDQFCNDIWNFSLEHNFSIFFNQYPEIVEINQFHKCKYNNIINGNIAKVNVYEENTLLQLEHEIHILNNEIMLTHKENSNNDLEYYKSILDNLKSYSDEITELIRYMTNLENAKNTYSATTNKKSNTVQGFISATNVLKEFNIHNCVLRKNNTCTTVATGFKEHCNIKSNIKFGTFIMKKRSLISLKFEQNVRTTE